MPIVNSALMKFKMEFKGAAKGPRIYHISITSARLSRVHLILRYALSHLDIHENKLAEVCASRIGTQT